MKVLLSPAKSLDYNYENAAVPHSIPILLEHTEKLLSKMKKMSAKKIGTLMNISPDLAKLNFERYQNFEIPTQPNDTVKQAGFVFSGEVYRGLDFRSFNEMELAFAQSSLCILSGLYGLLKPLDLIFPYRLEMGTKLAVTPKMKNLYLFWEKALNEALLSEMQENEVIVNLASNEYFKVIKPKILQKKIITPVFKELKGDQYKVVMTYAKHARGKMARYIVQNQINSVEMLKNYQEDGYRFHDAMSNETEWVFTR